MTEGGGQRIGAVDNSEGWGGMVRYMPRSRERSARQSGGGKGGRKAVRGYIHSCDKPTEQLCSLVLPSTMNVRRRTLHCEHTLRLQFPYLPPQKFGQLLIHQKQKAGVPNTRKAAAGPPSCSKVRRLLFVADGISRWCARDRTRDQISGTRGLPTEPRFWARAACRSNSLVCVSFLQCFRSAIAGSTTTCAAIASSSLLRRL